MDLKAYSNQIVRNVKHHPNVAGFRIKGKTLYRHYGDAIQLINFQGSGSNTVDIMKFTINLGIYLPSLAVLDEDPEMTTDILKAHWRSRIGSYMGDGTDYWWKVESEMQLRPISDEIVQVLEHSAIPAMNELSSVDALCAVWKRGEHPGIGKNQRTRFIELLCGE